MDPQEIREGLVPFAGVQSCEGYRWQESRWKLSTVCFGPPNNHFQEQVLTSAHRDREFPRETSRFPSDGPQSIFYDVHTG